MKKKRLQEYNRKRDFKVTQEPNGKASDRRKRRLTYVIQEHHASHLHYDFRLEWDGVLKSWAIPKGPSENPKDRRLAVHVEDHPLTYAKFKGTIPKGQYGAGKVYIWDSGTWEPENDPDEGLRKGKLEFEVKGKKLQGKWLLVRTSYQAGKGKDNWLLIKRQEQATQEGTLDFVLPQLPRLVDAVPEGKGWVHEMKFDGYRIQGHVHDGSAVLLTRTGLNWSAHFQNITHELAQLPVRNAIFDGEVVALDPEGRSDFQDLQSHMTGEASSPLSYYVFDLLFLDGQDLRGKPLKERKALLESLLGHERGIIRYSPHISTNGKKFFESACQRQWEGVVSKHLDAPYTSGRNDLWVKTKCTSRQEFVIGGWTEAKGSRSGFGALLLGVNENGKLRYAGKVGTGFSTQHLKAIYQKLKKLEVGQSPFKSHSPKGNSLHWVSPKLVAEINFSNWTRDGLLRTPSFVALRSDKSPKDITRENPIQHKFSHPEKVIFKKEAITKKEIADFYSTISSFILPLITDRPLSLVRCPSGSSGKCFYQKHVTGSLAESFISFPIVEEHGEGMYVAIDSPQGLIDMVQLNAFELHAWGCRRQDTEHPNQIVMDFDPGPRIKWPAVVEAAFAMKKILDGLKLKSFVKLTGGKGLHIHIPIDPIYDWEQVKSFSQTLAYELVSRFPSKYTANMAKNQRTGKIFIDYLRNGRGATSVIPYALRARPTSAVAMPLNWNELRRTKSSNQYSLSKALRKIRSRKENPWKGYEKIKQKIGILKPK